VSRPTGEFAPVSIEGQVELGYRAELAAMTSLWRHENGA
jgi:hypothetical protein